MRPLGCHRGPIEDRIAQQPQSSPRPLPSRRQGQPSNFEVRTWGLRCSAPQCALGCLCSQPAIEETWVTSYAMTVIPTGIGIRIRIVGAMIKIVKRSYSNDCNCEGHCIGRRQKHQSRWVHAQYREVDDFFEYLHRVMPYSCSYSHPSMDWRPIGVCACITERR